MSRDIDLMDRLTHLESVLVNQQTVQDSLIVIVNAQRREIAELKDEVANGGVISAATLDAALSRIDEMIESENLQTDEDNAVIVPPAPPAPEPSPEPAPDAVT